MQSLSTLKEDLRLAVEGLAQMQEPDAGYFEDPDNPQPHERAKLDQDVDEQCKAIDRLQRKIDKLEGKDDGDL